jgi:putative polyketide hydroxylase
VTRVPVLIVGTGAGGLATSAALAKHGVRSLVVEKRREVFIYPKARNLSFRSLEILRGLGLGDEVHAVAEGMSDMIVKPTLNSPEIERVLEFEQLFAEFAELTPERTVQYCPQSKLEPILLAYTRRLGSEARYGTELVSIAQDESGVSAVVRDVDSGESETVRADYLVAADGVHSRIRDMLGVATTGYGALPIYVVFVYFRGPWRTLVPQLDDGAAVEVKNADVDAIILSVEKDLGMFITTYFPSKGETAAQFTPQRSRELILAAAGEQLDVDIIDIAPWQPYERVSEQFRCGRVFFVGDAAHAMPPFKAGGANAAIQSADNLAWKIAAVLNGSAGDGLLASYHAERYPVGRFSARQSLTGPSVTFLRLDENRPALPADEEQPLFSMLVGYQYRSAAVITDEPAPADPGAVQLVKELRGQPGTRIPHVWLDYRGQRRSTLDLLGPGPGLTLLTGDSGDAWAASAASATAALGVPITAHRIGARDTDPDGQWLATTGLGPDGALLVRPDAFVGWRADTLPDDPGRRLRDTTAAILSRR